MLDIFSNLLGTQANLFHALTTMGRILLFWGGGAILLVTASRFVYWNLSSALRRRERARLFLNLLEAGAEQGKSLEQTIVSAARSRDKGLDVYFHLAAAYVEQGYRLEDALDKVPNLLSRRLTAMFRAARELGDDKKAFPLCRKILQDGAAKALLNQNNMAVVLFSLPVGVFFVGGFMVAVLPKLREIMLEYGLGPQSGVFRYFYWGGWLAGLSMVCWCLFGLLSLFPNGSPGEKWLAPLNHRLDLWLPWRRKQLQRDFSTLFAMLLDAGFTEAKALHLAARGTANRVLLQKAQRAIQALQQGAKLTEAMQELNADGELKWRLENAAASQLGFSIALNAWHEALDAKAYAQEQAASQVVSTGMVFLNGAMVGLIAVGLFRIFLTIIQEMVLW